MERTLTQNGFNGWTLRLSQSGKCLTEEKSLLRVTAVELIADDSIAAVHRSLG